MPKIEKQNQEKKLEKKPQLQSLPERFKAAYSKTRPYIAISLVISLQLITLIPYEPVKLTVLILLGISLAFMAGDLANLIKTHFSELKTMLEKTNQSIKKIEDPLHKVAFSSNLESPQVEVARKMYEASVRSANQLKKPRFFKNHLEYTNALISRIKRMKGKKSGRISAACGQKEWNDRLVQHWFGENYEALKQNVSINRIFLEEAAWTTDDKRNQSAYAEMKDQADNGINVRFAKLTELQNIEIFKNFPEGYGFVIFEYDDGEPPEVIVHNKPGEEKSLLFDDPMIVSQYISAFNELSKDLYSSKIKSDKQMDAGLKLEKAVLEELNEINTQVKRLIDHRFSNIQLNFVKWRLASESRNIKALVRGDIPIYALDKFTYLTDIFRHVIEQLNQNDVYQTISTVDFWSGNIPISKKCLKATSNALNNGAAIERVIFVDEDKLWNADEYRTNIKKIIDLFEAFSDQNHKSYLIKFLICKIGDENYRDMLINAPRALITESATMNRLEILTKHDVPRSGIVTPKLSLKFYAKEDYYIGEIESSFQEIVCVSKDVQEMNKILREIS